MDLVHKVVHTMATLSMTAAWVQSIKVEVGRQVFHDQKVKGLGLRVSFTGKKTWEVAYRLKGDLTKRRKDLGSFPGVSLSDARELAMAVLLEAAKGNDIKQKEREEALARKRAPTFEELADRFLKEHASKRRSRHQMELAIRKDLLPVWADRKARDISRRDVREVLQAVYDRGAPIQSNRTLALISSIFSWAIAQDLVETNPCLGVKRLADENPRERVLAESEIRAVWSAFEQIGGLVGDLFKLRLITAQRGAEVKMMRWVDIDMGSGWWTIPKEVAKNGKSHRVPLSAPALAILGRLQERTGDGEWVFPSRTRPGQPLRYLQKAAERVKVMTGVDFVLHDLRRTAASNVSSLMSDRFIVKQILNHSQSGDVTQVYDRYTYDAEKRRALDAWATRLMEVIGKPVADDSSDQGTAEVALDEHAGGQGVQDGV